MRIKLDKERNIKTPSDVIDNYEKYAKKIDSIYNKEFEKEIASSDNISDEERNKIIESGNYAPSYMWNVKD